MLAWELEMMLSRLEKRRIQLKEELSITKNSCLVNKSDGTEEKLLK